MRKSIASIALIRREAGSQTLWLAQWNEGWQAFSFVGGHKRVNESFRECMIREIAEELDLREGQDVLVSSAPLEHLEYTDVSRRTGEQTEYVIELFDVALTGSGAQSRVDANPANRWLSEPEIMAEACDDGRPISATPKRFLAQLGWDLFVSYAHKDDVPDGWVTALVQAIRAEHAEFTPTPLRVFFDRQEIRTMDDWQRRILDGLHASKLMLAVLSDNYFRSDYCRMEWRVYRDHEIRRQMQGESIAPIYIVTVPGFEGPAKGPADEWLADLWQRTDLQRRQYLDVRQWRPHGVDALKELEVRRRLRNLDQQISERLTRARRVSESKNTVPRPSDRFVGRHAELARLRETLPQGRIAAITAVQGIGGIGKTALAFLYSQAFADHYPGGRFLVDAAGLSDLRIVFVRLAADLGIELNEAEQQDLDRASARVRTVFEQRARSLLILDNVDQADLLDPRRRARVLPATDRLHVLLTTRLDQEQLVDAGVDCLALDPLPETDALELLNRHRTIAGDDAWKAALRIVRLLGGHSLALEVVAVCVWKHADVTYCDYLARLEAQGVFTALTGTAADRAVQLSENPQKLIGPLLEPTLASLTDVELRAIEYAALLTPDAVSLPWVRDLVAADFPRELAPRPGYADPWREIERRLFGLRLWLRREDDRLARMHRIAQEVTRARLAPSVLDQCRHSVTRYALTRAEMFANSSTLSEYLWEVEPLRDYALLRMADDDPGAAHVAQWLSEPLHDLGRLADAGILARAAVACGQRLAAADPGNAGWQRDLSVSQGNIGDVLSAQGDLTAALAGYRASLDIRQRLAAADPGNAGWQRDLSVSHNNIGDVLSAQGDLFAALSAYRASLDISQRLAAADPGNAGWQRDLSVSNNNIGNVLSAQGDLTAALSAYRASHELFARLAAADPGNAGWQRDLSVSNNNIGNVLSAQGDLTAALSAYRASLDIRQRLAAADPGNAGWQRDLSVSQDNIGNVLSAQGDLTAALAAYRTSLDIGQRLAAADPGNAGWQRDLSVSQDNIGNVLSAQGDLTAAFSAYRASLDISQRLAATDPGNAGWQRDLSVSHSRIGDVLRAQGDLTAALSAYRASLDISQRLAAADPGNAGWQRNLSVSHEKIGDVLRAQGDLTAALSACRASLDIRQRLAAADPGNAGWQRDLSVSHNNIGDVLSAQGNLTAGLSAYRASLDISQRLAAADPGNARWQRDVSVSHNQIGDVLSAQGDLTAALSAYRASHEIFARLAAADPGNAGWQRDLSVSHNKIGDVLRAQGDLTAALSAYRASHEIFARLAAADPGNAGWQRDLWLSYWRLASMSEQTQSGNAREWWQKAYDVLSTIKCRGLFVSAQDEQCLAQLRNKLGL